MDQLSTAVHKATGLEGLAAQAPQLIAQAAAQYEDQRSVLRLGDAGQG